MPLLDISGVTRTLINLIKYHVESNGPGFSFDVSPEPPDKLKGANVIGMYLYHLSENGHYKNLPSPGNDQPPLRYTPMALDLHYQITAHSEANENGIYNEQEMMGLAVKALRDYPVIDDSTELIDSTGTVQQIMDSELYNKENRLRIMLQPIPHNEAVSFWTAGSLPLRLAAYYLVSVVLLKPEETKSRTGRVLSYGAYSFVSGTPRLESSENVIAFNPDPTGLHPPRHVTVRPAQVPLGGVVTFKGSSLSGDQTSLILRSSRWERESVVADSDWKVKAFGDRVEAIILPTISFSDRDDTIVPGIYSARVRVKTYRTVSDGSIREFEHASNETPFMVTARVDGDDVLTPSAGGAVSLGGYGFEHPDLPSDSLEIRVGDTQLQRGSSASLGPGQYDIVNSFAGGATTPDGSPIPDDPQTLRLVVPAELQPRVLIPLRIFVNGAESPPKWILIP